MAPAEGPWLGAGASVMDKLVIVPTYNERENISVLIDRLLALSCGLEVLVVDDNSPDGTGDLVEERRQADPRIHLLRRPSKLGLGSAYVAGFRYALERGAEYVFEMDADFSHDPNAIPLFLETAQDADLVLGSRYLQGVTVVHWPLSRLILSYSANVYTRIITGLPVRDATGGFKCFRRRALLAVNLDHVRSDGYAFQIEMTYKVWRLGLRIREIPITFVDRRAGVSKMNRRIVWEAAGLVWRLRFMRLLGQIP